MKQLGMVGNNFVWGHPFRHLLMSVCIIYNIVFYVCVTDFFCAPNFPNFFPFVSSIKNLSKFSGHLIGSMDRLPRQI